MWLSRLKKLIFSMLEGPPTRHIFRQRKLRKADWVVSLNPYTVLVENSPQGYPRLAAFLSSDENFMIYRSFGFLHARVLLHRQDELRIMERDLDQMDQRHARNGNSQILKCRVDDDCQIGQGGSTRKALLIQIEDALLK